MLNIKKTFSQIIKFQRIQAKNVKIGYIFYSISRYTHGLYNINILIKYPNHNFPSLLWTEFLTMTIQTTLVVKLFIFS